MMGGSNHRIRPEGPTFQDKVAARLQAYDSDRDGQWSHAEVATIVEELYVEETRSKSLRRMIAAVAGALAFIVLANLAMGIAISYLSKELQVGDDGVLTATDSDQPVKVASYDVEVSDDNQLRARDGKGTIRVSQAPMAPYTLHSTLPDQAFDELRIVKFQSADGKSSLTLSLQGWARITPPDSPCQSYVKLITGPGHIKLVGAIVEFEDVMGDLFVESGFAIDMTGRKLLGIYEIVGLFNSVEAWEGLAATETPPGFGSADFYMEYTVRYPCKLHSSGCRVGADTYLLNYMDGYAQQERTALHDTANGAVLESVRSAEWPQDMRAVFTNSTDKHGLQVHMSNGVPLLYNCMGFNLTRDEASPLPPVWDILRATKIGEEQLPGCGVHRYFQLEVAVDEFQYMTLSGLSEPVGYDGYVSLVYVDDKETGEPKRFLFDAGLEYVVTKYEERPVDFSAWRMPDTEICPMTSEDGLTPVPAVARSPFSSNLMRDSMDGPQLRGLNGTFFAPDGSLSPLPESVWRMVYDGAFPATVVEDEILQLDDLYFEDTLDDAQNSTRRLLNDVDDLMATLEDPNKPAWWVGVGKSVMGRDDAKRRVKDKMKAVAGHDLTAEERRTRVYPGVNTMYRCYRLLGNRGGADRPEASELAPVPGQDNDVYGVIANRCRENILSWAQRISELLRLRILETEGGKTTSGEARRKGAQAGRDILADLCGSSNGYRLTMCEGLRADMDAFVESQIFEEGRQWLASRGFLSNCNDDNEGSCNGLTGTGEFSVDAKALGSFTVNYYKSHCALSKVRGDFKCGSAKCYAECEVEDHPLTCGALNPRINCVAGIVLGFSEDLVPGNKYIRIIVEKIGVEAEIGAEVFFRTPVKVGFKVWGNLAVSSWFADISAGFEGGGSYAWYTQQWQELGEGSRGNIYLKVAYDIQILGMGGDGTVEVFDHTF